MKEQTGYFEGVNKTRLFSHTWIPDGEIKAVLVVLHGAGEHIGRYQNMVNGLVPAGYLVTGYDLRGHGRSEGQRGHINSWDEYRGDVKIFLERAHQLAPEVPLFVYGHSHGTLDLLDWVCRFPQGIAGVILSGAVFEAKAGAPPHMVLLAKVMSGIWPTMTIKQALPGVWLSRDPQVVKAYNEDPLVSWKRSPRWGTESLKLITWINENVAGLKVPVLFLHGEKDPIVSAEGAKRAFERVELADKTIHIYPDGLHEPHNDIQYPEVVADIRAWLEAHLG